MARRARRARVGDGGGGSSGSLSPTPQNVSGLQAWFDPTSDAYFTFSTGAQISAWLSRAGAMGAVSLAQSTSSLQPLRDLSTASFNNKNTVLFDGSNDALVANNGGAAWKFMHDGTGGEVIFTRRIDSTGNASQYLMYTGVVNTHVGFYMLYHSVNNGQAVIHDGDGSQVNGTTSSLQGVRDVTAWQSLSYSTNSRVLRVSGASQDNLDVVGQVPSASNATVALTLAASSAYKGHVGDVIAYNKVLTTGERSIIINYLARKYGVAA